MTNLPVLVVLYNPSEASLSRLRTRYPHSPFFIFDNSPVSQGAASFDGSVYQWSASNVGISGALVWMLRECKQRGYSHFLFLDQDTVFDGGVFTQVRTELDRLPPEVGIANFTSDATESPRGMTAKNVQFAINSGSVFSVKTLDSVAEQVLSRFFVDAVDLAICVHARHRGFSVVRLRVEGIDHVSEQGFRRAEALGCAWNIKIYSDWRRREFYLSHCRLIADCLRLARFVDAAMVLKFMVGFVVGQLKCDIVLKLGSGKSAY